VLSDLKIRIEARWARGEFDLAQRSDGSYLFRCLQATIAEVEQASIWLAGDPDINN